ncbi:MAG: ATP-binding cassette domain-containing protein [Bacillales bacterium]|jgi:ABC-type lipoprotein export system ATPase subunit|nr:ATP-binding cassette domain-containing protein [Bacillales bacterium]
MLEIKNLSKTYVTKANVTTRALININLSFEEKGLVYILGRSGSGKSTLLNVMSGLDTFDKGDLLIYGNSIKNFKKREYDSYRNTFVGFVFQDFNLIPNLTVYENVELALNLQSNKDNNKVNDILEKVGLLDKAKEKAFALSGGQIQRVAIARALIKNPSIIFADEPTGSLDQVTAKEIIDIFKALSQYFLVIVVSHNREDASKYADRIIELEDGRVIKDLTTLGSPQEAKKTVRVIGDRIIKLQKNEQLDEDSLKKLNNILLDERRDYYISAEQDINKVKAYYPYLREAIGSSDVSTNEPNTFSQYVPQESISKEIKLKKSNLPFAKGLKLGVSYLKTKIVRLVVTLVLAIAGVIMFAIGDNFSNYDIYYAMALSTKNSKLSYLQMTSEASFYEESINKVETLLKKESQNVYTIPLKIDGYVAGNNDIFSGVFNNIWEIDNIENYGFKYIYKSNKIASDTDGIITYSVADLIIARKFPQYKIQDLIDKELNLEIYDSFPYNVTIKGIIDGPKVSNDINDLLTTPLIVKSNFIQKALNSIGVVPLNGKVENVSDNYILVNKGGNLFNTLPTILTEIDANDNTPGIYLSEPLSPTVLVDFSLNATVVLYKDLKVKGYHGLDNNIIITDSEVFNEIIKNVTVPTSLTFSVKKNNAFSLASLYKKIYQNGYKVSSTIVDSYSAIGLVFTILGPLLTNLSTFIFALVVILLYSFMSFSIKEHTRQAGILRAIGANQFDIIKIFLLEAATIGIIALAFGIAGYGIVGAIINQSANVDNLFGSYIYYSTFSFLTILKMIGVVLIVLSIALIIPIIRLVRMQPVDAIREKNN